MKKILILLWMCMFFSSYSQDSLTKKDSLSPFDSRKGTKYLSLTSYGLIGIGKKVNFSVYQISPEISGGFFLSDHIVTGLSFAYNYTHVESNNNLKLSGFTEFSFPRVAYYFYKNKLFVENGLAISRYWEKYSYDTSKNYKTNFLFYHIGGGINLKILKNKNLGWFSQRLAFQLYFRRYFPFFGRSIKSTNYNWTFLRLGLVLYI